MFTELIDKIVVYESEGVGKARTQKVDIYFNYVGQVDIAYTEEELAEIKEQEEQEEKKRLEKQRQREKAYREKRKAKKLAENGGEIVKTKVCPHCQTVSRNYAPRNVKRQPTTRKLWIFTTRNKRRKHYAKIYYRRKNRYPILTHRRLLLSLPDSRGKSSPFKIWTVAATIFGGT